MHKKAVTIRPLKAKRLVNILAEREAEVKVDTVIYTLAARLAQVQP